MRATLVVATTLLVVWCGVEARHPTHLWFLKVHQQPLTKHYLNVEGLKIKTRGGMVPLKPGTNHNDTVEPRGGMVPLKPGTNHNETVEPRGGMVPLKPGTNHNETVEPRGGMVPLKPGTNHNETVEPRGGMVPLRPSPGANGLEIEPLDHWKMIQSRLAIGSARVTLQPGGPGMSSNHSAMGPKWSNIMYQERNQLACGQIVILNSGDTRIIESKNYPNNYPNFEKCIWSFELASSDDTLRVQCDDFSLQDSNKCKKDFLRFKYGSVNKRHCGIKDPFTVETKQPLKVTFKTNKKRVDRGFSCTVKAVAPTTQSTTATTGPPQTTRPPQTTESPVSDCPNCGQVNRVPRIVGGVETEVNEYPWQVALSDPSGSFFFCGGTIISDQWVLTAAHCAEGMTTDNKVLIGSHSLSSYDPQHLVSISQILVHPSYNDWTLDNDVALLKLSSPIQFPDDNTIAPACLPVAGELYENVDVTVTGWGALSEGGSFPDKLYEVTVPTLSNDDCNDANGGVTSNMICAGVPEGGKDSCQGDSGGPMVYNDNGKWRVIGVVSWGYGCARPGLPGVYARVTSFLDWIAQETDENCLGGDSTEPPPPPPTEEPTTSAPIECPECGRANQVLRIVGGEETAVNEYPWQVAIYSSSGDYFFCGGTILSDLWVLTAAHCAEYMSMSDKVLLGSHNLYSYAAENLVSISQKIVHPDYDDWTLDNDVALLRLSSPIQFPNDNTIAPACLPTAGELYEDVDVTVTGWGALSEGGSGSNVLYEVTVPTMSNDECNGYYWDEVTDNMICAGLPDGGKDSCQGDSGGPMVYNDGGRWRLVGVVSWGYGCARPNSPGVYARVTEYLDWISQITSGSCLNGDSVETGVLAHTPPPEPETDCQCGIPNRSSRIVGGTETEVNEYPWQVGLVNGDQYYFFCGGSIISDQWVLTAAHCAERMTTRDLVLVGEHDYYDGYETDSYFVRISQIIMHPDYSSAYTDAALLRLSTPLQFNDDNVAPVCLPLVASQLYQNVEATVTGWGAQSEDGPYYSQLYEVTVPTMNNVACNSDYGGGISSNMICAGLPEGEKDSCYGDSGGPLVYMNGGNYEEIGIVSWGYGCARPGYPGVYARVTTLLSWIYSNTAGSHFCRR